MSFVAPGILVLLTAFSTTSAAATEFSPAEVKIMLEEFHRVLDSCAPGCLPPGVNLDSGTVSMRASDVEARDKVVTEYEGQAAPKNQDSGLFGRVVANCKLKTAPQLDIDVAAVKLFNGLQRALPFDLVFHDWADACGNPPNVDNIGFSQKVKKVHFKIVEPHKHKAATNIDPEEYGYEYGFDARSGILTVGVWEQIYDKQWFIKWLDRQ